jgi:hypothetical protein
MFRRKVVKINEIFHAQYTFFLRLSFFPVRGCERARIVTKCVRFHTDCDSGPLTCMFISRDPLATT